jgi:hypothetical protein
MLSGSVVQGQPTAALRPSMIAPADLPPQPLQPGGD